jgi:hypothetical protein
MGQRVMAEFGEVSARAVVSSANQFRKGKLAHHWGNLAFGPGRIGYIHANEPIRRIGGD